MTADCVAVVSPREDRRNAAKAWAALLRGRARLQLCATLDDATGAEVLALDAECPDLGLWLGRAADRRHIVLFGNATGDCAGALPWGRDGEEILAAISNLLDRRALLERSDEIRDSLLASSDTLDEHRRRVSTLEAGDADRESREPGAPARDVERLARVAAVARFLAAPGDEARFAERLCEVVARAVGALGVALARGRAGDWRLEGRFRLSSRTAQLLLRDLPAPEGAAFDLPCGTPTRRGFALTWRSASEILALVGTAVPERDPSRTLGAAAVAELTALLADALAAREATTAQLQRKTQSERAVQTLRSGLLKIDSTERVVLVNPALAEILETDALELEGRPLADALPRDPHVVELLRSALARDEWTDDVETFVTSSGGRRIQVSLRASRLGEPSAPAEGLLVLLSDLARRKELEEEIRKAERLAALGRLSAGVAHEIRNPLAGIRTTAELLRSRLATDADLARFVDVILEETERLDRIVGSLLQFAKPSPPKRQPLRTGDLLQRARQLAAGRSAERGVAVRVVEAAGVPEPDADRDQMLQVLLNLVLNAIDATPAGGEVVLRTETDEREIRFVVEDGGAGVPARLRERVFDPFFTTKPGGTGLGLSISQNVLRQHGGRLRLERPEGGASRAVASLPRHSPGTVHAIPGGATWPTS